jgi:hypothetical protein
MGLRPKDYLNPSNIRAFVEGNFMMFRDKFLDKSIPKHIKEQALYRALLCRHCLIKGECIECGCTTPNLFFSKSKIDAGGKWEKMLTYSAWEKYKKSNDLTIPDSFEMIKDIEHGRHTG